MKRCTGCGQEKPLASFFRNSSSPDGHHSRCKDCHQSVKYDSCPRCGARKWVRSQVCETCGHEAQRGVDRVAVPSHEETGRNRARARFALHLCEFPGCERSAADRHHIDGDTANNAPENIQRLCRRHHMLVDGRLKQLADRAVVVGALGGRPRKDSCPMGGGS